MSCLLVCDRAPLQVWDLQAGQMLYQSSILGVAVPTCLALDASAARLAMGCADGSVRQFDLAQLPACRELQVLDLSKAVQQVATAAAAAAAAAERSLASASKAAASPKPKPKKALPDKPVTFHKQIKSSGYGFVQPKVKLGQAKPAPVKVGGPGASRVPQLLSQQLSGQRRYPLDAVAPGEWALQPEQGLPGGQAVHNGAVLRLEFAGDGCRLLTAASDKTARCLWLPLSKHAGAGTTFVGHGGPVSCVSWSHTGELLLTASADSSSGGSNSSSSSAAQQGFLSEVTAAQFFYVDQFVLLATGSKLHVYKLPDAAAEDDIQRLRASGSYSLAGSYSAGCQAITDVAAANSFLSTLLLLACSNRSIQLVDAATMQVACSIPDAHARPVQRLAQPPGSPFVSHPREVQELFASCAPDGLVKLWDVRSGPGPCVRSFSGHKNSQMAIGLAFSPCMRYLATGSEDKAAYAEVVADVAFHPWRPELVVGCMDGRVHCYGGVF
ncbi:WD40-repeat-containing domain protein [Scenedesmus sp. NREL 46B-D3]|nr:WD40-repeat-containing domain protein [Scenedesmus sp. NREL 46B-D3]